MLNPHPAFLELKGLVQAIPLFQLSPTALYQNDKQVCEIRRLHRLSKRLQRWSTIFWMWSFAASAVLVWLHVGQFEVGLGVWSPVCLALVALGFRLGSKKAQRQSQAIRPLIPSPLSSSCARLPEWFYLFTGRSVGPNSHSVSSHASSWMPPVYQDPVWEQLLKAYQRNHLPEFFWEAVCARLERLEADLNVFLAEQAKTQEICLQGRRVWTQCLRSH